MSKRRVVVTGLGAVTPVGLSVAESWENILAGKSGVAPITSFDVTDFPVRFGASVKDFDVETVISRKDAKKMDTFIHYGIAAAVEAIKDAGLEVTDANAERIGVAIGSGIGGLPGIEAGYDSFLNGGPRKISPFFVPSNIINMISGNLSIMYGMKGPNTAIVTACSTGTHCISAAGRMIQYGDADVMIAGGAEMATSKTGLGGFAAARALSTRNDDPLAASRPWDKDRDGFVLGDGAGVIVLEEYEHAKKRGATIYAELIGSGMSSDAYHMTMPSQGGEGAARCMVNAMNDAGINPEDIHYINAHGTSTPAGDVAETQAIKTALGNASEQVAVSSTKSMIGHLLGAAGGVEAVFSILAIRDQVAPPTINLDNPDEACDLDYVPHTARQMPIDISMSNSFGFGGTNGTVIFKKLD
ncbi:MULTISPECIES: beta-ketoacyl-ACP synthase II [unclassified Methylophaga]|jgi:3-oxoacyl-[acyl-carrier-protein] synthase II|uniref:3-oxoacyl-[acyl-carrier-protein] synthase 2 n=1 Tax=Pseudidiomarina aestuarii TaxID=624146 RepID=A0A2T4CYX3_9GAMM|nr:MULTISPECIES: beta-ketoacyl-ACP synthase II [unclassified Methylophaga]PTB86739.1 beta-ketoacyl-[acyl-carrier-protein] synthase II [Pseudidiomarina aestuarii]MAL48771.1 beta-ketoacyl-[acyl-carrier-protein] synthase II [Methylophaga sp.]MAP25662.1 beta-ketoacyl-[acyl-carrier-protein] synthase II [Methylophaga sp.]MBP25021.1 beta-ketoacyl-[acyl-carrier-protein] synthase II [Methylophaga sp.]HAD31872.1 beta-ketoacyl-[acyl-carrier-protein] synthase II [Methylophaga sp.]|tara:strand:- start:3702 stop:4943 length:1242 start_codon:yes stop_codon:yes gene_type:complete